MTAAGGAAKQLPLPPTSFGNPTAVAEAIKAPLLKNNTIDGVITISAGDADSAANGIMQAGAAGRVKLGRFDMNQTILDRIAERHPALRDRPAALPAGLPRGVAAATATSTSAPTCRRARPDRSRHRRRLQRRADDGRREAGRPLTPRGPIVRPASRAGRTPSAKPNQDGCARARGSAWDPHARKPHDTPKPYKNAGRRDGRRLTPVSGLLFGGLLRRPETGAFLGLLFVFVFFAIFGGDQLPRAHRGGELPQRRRQPRHRRAARSAS